MGSRIHEYKTESLNYTKFNYVFIMVSAYYTSVEPVTYNPCKYLTPRNDKRLSNSVVVYCMSIVAFFPFSFFLLCFVFTSSFFCFLAAVCFVCTLWNFKCVYMIDKMEQFSVYTVQCGELLDFQLRLNFLHFTACANKKMNSLP